MRVVILLIFCLFLNACSQATLRIPASNDSDFQYGDVDPEKSVVKIFPPQILVSSFRYFFYLELKDELGKYVDCDPSEVSLKKVNGESIDFKWERSLRGRYYLTLEESDKNHDVRLNLFIRNVALKKEVKLMFKKANRNKSWLKAVRTERNGIRLKLFLGDSKGKPITLPSVPEIILDGQAEVENLKQVDEGTWEFSLVYPNVNQVIYVSIRAHGTFMADMFRIQYLEK